MTDGRCAPHNAASAPYAASAPRRLAARLAVVAIPGLAFCLLYLPALDYGYAWTDTSSIGGRTLLRPAGELIQAFREPLHRIEHRGAAAQQAYYRPLQVIALSLVDTAFGRRRGTSGAVGLLFSVLAVGVFAAFALRLLGSAPAALLAALFVACHPVGIETVVWISALSGPMSAAFLVAALALALAAAQSGSWAPYVGGALASGVALFGGLLSKELAVVEPALLLALFLAVAADDGPSGRAGLERGRAGGLLLLHVACVAVYTFAWRPAVLGAALVPLPPHRRQLRQPARHGLRQLAGTDRAGSSSRCNRAPATSFGW